MIITNIENHEFHTEVTAATKHEELGFQVQLTDGEYRSDLGCWITTASSGEDINDEDYPSFNIDEIINAAEAHYAAEFEESFTETEVEFHCAINDCVVIMRTSNESGSTQLYIRNNGYVGAYQYQTYTPSDYEFTSEAEALEFANSFRTDDYNDFAGLNNLMREIEQWHS
ncbi:MAG: hypothetical protein GY941_21060 [Planctomycetes bacterium]|nr:hypothetical protein [Planctomycetota bacterium]